VCSHLDALQRMCSMHGWQHGGNIQHCVAQGPCGGCVQGTTTNGRYLLPFRTGAFVAGVPVQPVLLSYPQLPRNPSLAWETVTAPRHIFLVFSCLLHTARVWELPLYRPSLEEQSDPALYAANVRKFMVRLCACCTCIMRCARCVQRLMQRHCAVAGAPCCVQHVHAYCEARRRPRAHSAACMLHVAA
jgi:hypothetical protein